MQTGGRAKDRARVVAFCRCYEGKSIGVAVGCTAFYKRGLAGLALGLESELGC